MKYLCMLLDLDWVLWCNYLCLFLSWECLCCIYPDILFMLTSWQWMFNRHFYYFWPWLGIVRGGVSKEFCRQNSPKITKSCSTYCKRICSQDISKIANLVTLNEGCSCIGRTDIFICLLFCLNSKKCWLNEMV